MNLKFLEIFSKLESHEQDAWFQSVKTPIIETIAKRPESCAVTFIYKLSEDDLSRNASIYLLSSLAGYDFTMTSKFVHFPNSKLAYLTLILPADARGAYNIVKLYDELEKFEIPASSVSTITYPRPSKELNWFNNLLGFLFEAGRVELDSRNKNKITYFKDMDNPIEIYGEESIVELPNAPSHPTIPKSFKEIKLARDELTKANRLIADKYKLTSTHYNSSLVEDRKYWIYLPNNYDHTSQHTYPLLVFLDGSSYLDYIPARCILEELIKNNDIPPCIAIFLDCADGPTRNYEYNCNTEFTNFLTKEFIPNLISKYHLNIDDNPNSRILVGSSMSGCTAFYAGLTYPESFGKVIMQSPCFLLQKLDFLKTFIDNSQKLGKFIFEVGTFEKNSVAFEFEDGEVQITSTYDSVQTIKDYMQSANMDVTLYEFAGGHNYVCYRESLYELIHKALPKTNIFGCYSR